MNTFETVFVQTRGTLRTMLVKAIRDGVNIETSAHPPTSDDHAIPGEWECQLLSGTHGSAIGVLTERTTRFTILTALADGDDITRVRDAIARQVLRLDELPQQTTAPGPRVIFCHPDTPWHRTVKENTVALLRQYLPENTDLNRISQTRLNSIATEMNTRPRKTLDAMTPIEALTPILENSRA